MAVKLDPQVAAHLEWLGFVRPTGLVVSPPALVRAGVILNRRDAEGQRLLAQCVEERRVDPEKEPEPCLPDFRAFASSVLGWSFSPRDYAVREDAPIPPELEMPLSEFGEVLRPDFAVSADLPQTAPAPASGLAVGEPAPAYNVHGRTPPSESSPWQLLVCVHPPGEDFDRVTRADGGLEASPHGRMERLLRHTGVPAGLLFNGTTLRFVSAPRGESSGWIDFRVADMLQTAGRPISTALRALLGEMRLLGGPRSQRLAALLEESRKFQNEVSERLSEQVLHALYELLRGFQAAHDASRGELLRQPLAENPDEVYRGLLTVVLRLVFLLYSEERDMLPQQETFLRSYSLAGLYERLREDSALYPDTMDQRYGAWPQLLALFRMVHDGASSGEMHLPPRHGDLFDPDRYRFLEARSGTRQVHERIEPPRVSDGAVHRVLEKLMVLDGERISYRALDVEHVGSVYETMMGFRLEIAQGRTAAIKAAKKRGAPAAVDLEALLGEAPSRRAKWLQSRSDRKLTDHVSKAVCAADTIEALHAALDPVIDGDATPDLVPEGAMVLQPTEERRRSGSHYTPRALTGPIVRRTLEPILARLRTEQGGPPRPERILDLKVCDLAMGSGAFLVEACRQLGAALVESWRAHDAAPEIPPDEDAVIFARREVAQRCLYGVDRNAKAVDLAKLSLWLVTLARDHPLTFLNHALRHGDSLVGLSLPQLEAFHWKGSEPQFQHGFEEMQARKHLARAGELRRRIREADDAVSDWEKKDLLDEAEYETTNARLLGDLLLAAFFDGVKPTDREHLRGKFADVVQRGEMAQYLGWIEELRREEPPLAPFHWEIEFPEVFDRKNPGFDAVVGNPPFAGKNTVASANAPRYPDWLQHMHEGSHGNADLAAHFFLRAFGLLRQGGAFGLIATNTIAQGDTRATGLRWLCKNGGEIYHARRRLQWPGEAAVVVSVVHTAKGPYGGARLLDGRSVDTISAFLSPGDSHDDPETLEANAGKSFQGSIVLGMGFTFDDRDKKGVATPLSEMRRLIGENPRNRDVIFPYIGGQEINTDPFQAHHRYVINFRDWPLRRADLGTRWADANERRRRDWLRTGIVPLDYPEPVAMDWPELLAIVEERVKPERLKVKREVRRKRWWQFGDRQPALYAAVAGLDQVLAISQLAAIFALTFLPKGMVYNSKMVVFPCANFAPFATLQSRPHEIWARFFGSSMKDDLSYTPSDCFETFPFPAGFPENLEAAGKTYYEFRANLMIKNAEGLTKTYNRFHDPYKDDPDIANLRDLHAAMDRAVLDAYGWSDIPTECEFLLDYEIDEEEWGSKKKPYRYRWPDEVRDEVLARLLALNAERHAEEVRSQDALAEPPKFGKRARRKPGPITATMVAEPGLPLEATPPDEIAGGPDEPET